MRALVMACLLLASCSEVEKDPKYMQEYPEGTPRQVRNVADLPYNITRFCDGRNLVYTKSGQNAVVLPAAPECGQ